MLMERDITMYVILRYLSHFLPASLKIRFRCARFFHLTSPDVNHGPRFVQSHGFATRGRIESAERYPAYDSRGGKSDEGKGDVEAFCALRAQGTDNECRVMQIRLIEFQFTRART